MSKTYWERDSFTFVIERWHPHYSRIILGFLKTLLRTCIGEDKAPFHPLRFGVKIAHFSQAESQASKPSYTITIATKEERKRYQLLDRTTRKKIMQTFLGGRLNDFTDVKLQTHLRRIEKRNFARKMVLRKRLQFLVVYEERMEYTEKEDVEWPVVRGLAEMWERRVDGETSLLRIIGEAAGRKRGGSTGLVW